MLRKSVMKAVCGIGFAAVLVPVLAQDAGVLNPPAMRGLNPLMTGVFITPIPGSPLSATVLLQSVRPLQDGTTESFKTVNHIARDAGGRIYNERRRLVPSSFTGTPQLLSSHIYDPETRLNTFLNRLQHIARHSVLKGPAPNWDQRQPWRLPPPANAESASVRREDLGSQVMENVTVQGERVFWTVPASASGTGQPVVVTDEYWYSEELHLNMLIRHNDPRAGEQTSTITHVKREDPDPQIFKTPSDYKVVDETPGTEN